MTHLSYERLIDYIHGELEPAEDALAHTHLTACSECRAELEQETAMAELFRRAAAATERDLPPAVLAGVRDAIRRERQPFVVTLLRVWMRPAVALPTAAALLIGAFLAGPLTHPAAQAPRPTIDAAFYLDQHAEQQAPDPLAEHPLVPPA